MTEPTEVETSGLLADPAQTTELLSPEVSQTILQLGRDLAKARAERDALLPRLAELTEQAGKERTTEWLRICTNLPPEEWSPAPAYKGPMVPAAELAERQGRIDAALAVLDGASQFGLTKPGALHAVRAALAGDQPTTEEPGLCDGCDRTEAPVKASDDGRAQFCPTCLPQANQVGVGDDTSEEENRD